VTAASAQPLAISPAVTAAIHVAHAGLVIIGVLVVIAMLSPLAMHRRRAAVAELRVAATSGDLVRLAELRARQRDDPDPSRHRAVIVAATGSLIAAGVHAAVCPEHFHEALRYGVFFVVASLSQTGWAVLLVRRPSRRLFLIGAIGSVGMVALWGLTRTVGLPFGLAEVENVGIVDLVATIAEVTTVVSCGLGAGLVERPRAVGAATPGRA
jgi:hypothetical protein